MLHYRNVGVCRIPNKNGKNHRQPVEFVSHPDTDEPVDGLRFHKATSLYYRIEPKRRKEKRAKIHYYPQHGLKGVAYLRRAVFEHECHSNGLAPTTDLAHIPIQHPLLMHDTLANTVSPMVVTL